MILKIVRITRVAERDSKRNPMESSIRGDAHPTTRTGECPFYLKRISMGMAEAMLPAMEATAPASRRETSRNVSNGVNIILKRWISMQVHPQGFTRAFMPALSNWRWGNSSKYLFGPSCLRRWLPLLHNKIQSPSFFIVI